MTQTEQIQLISEAQNHHGVAMGLLQRVGEILNQLATAQAQDASATVDIGPVEPDPLVTDPSAETAAQVAGNENEALQDESL